MNPIFWLITNLFKQPCKHKNMSHRKWLDKDNTPMIFSQCRDCHYVDQGHVYADAEGWLDPPKYQGPYYDPLYDDLDSPYPNPPHYQ